MQERNIDQYQAEYDQLPFEPTMAAIRRKVILNFLRQRAAKNILEVGCGNHALFNDYRDYEQMTVIEPSAIFFERLRQDAQKYPGKNIRLINDLFTGQSLTAVGVAGVDTIIISGLLHELPDPKSMLQDAFKLANAGTMVHVNVPNALSLHRLMALEMGLLQDVRQKTALQQRLQQHHTFDLQSLAALAGEAGFKVVDSGSYFIKPFSHKQMEALQQHPLFGDRVIDGFEKLVRHLPDNGAEIYLNLQKK